MGRLFNHTHRRSHWFRYIGLCAVALLAATRPAIAVDPRAPAANYLRQTFTTADGLPSNVVNDVLQTRDGFLIVGTANGVSRFDGHRFAGLNSDPPKAIIVRSLAEGSRAAIDPHGRRRVRGRRRRFKALRHLDFTNAGGARRSCRADYNGR